MTYFHPRLLYLMAWSWIWGFAWLFVAGIGVAMVFLFHSVTLVTIAFCLFLPAGLFVTVGRWFLRCPKCRCVVLIGRRPEHPDATRAYRGRGLAGIIVDIAMKRQFTCLQCGYHCRLFECEGPNLRWSRNPGSAGTGAPLLQAGALRPPVHHSGVRLNSVPLGHARAP